jgi:hypothetical protein
MRPYFTAEEISTAVAHGISPDAFPEAKGSKIRLIPHPAGQGYICPAFEVETHRCRIYPVRPLDCRLYPFSIMRPPQGDGVLLGWDRKCPFLREETDRTLPLTVSAEIARQLQEGGERSILARHPGLIGEFQEDVWVMEPLPALRSPERTHPEPPDSRLIPLAPDDYVRLKTVCARAGSGELSTGEAATLMMWQALMKLWWAQIDGGHCLVAEQSGTFFLPVPPFSTDLVNSAATALDLLDRLNRNPAVSRIERVSESQRPLLEAAGFFCRRQGVEYLYDRKALAGLPGDRYKSPRWNYNQAKRRYRPRYESYLPSDLSDCLRLYARWRAFKESKSGDSSEGDYPDALMADSFYAHWQVMTHVEEWGLIARVARVGSALAAYTVGLPVHRDVFVVLLEIGDPDRPGLGSYLFREFCREMKDYRWVNTMDDSDLPSLRRSKMAYHPARLIPFFTVTRPG